MVAAINFKDKYIGTPGGHRWFSLQMLHSQLIIVTAREVDVHR